MLPLFLLALVLAGTSTPVKDVLQQSDKKMVVAGLSQQQLEQSLDVTNADAIGAIAQKFDLQKREDEEVVFLSLKKDKAAVIDTPSSLGQSALLLLQSSSQDRQEELLHGVSIQSFAPGEQEIIRQVIRSYSVKDENGNPLADRQDLRIILAYRPLITFLVDGKVAVDHVPAWEDENSPIDSGRMPVGFYSLPIICIAYVGIDKAKTTIQPCKSYTLSELATICRQAEVEVYVEPRLADKPIVFSQAVEPKRAIELAAKLYGLKLRQVGPAQVICQYTEGYVRAKRAEEMKKMAKYQSGISQVGVDFERMAPDSLPFTGISQRTVYNWSNLSDSQKEWLQPFVKGNLGDGIDKKRIGVVITPSFAVIAQIAGQNSSSSFFFGPEDY